MIFSVDGFPVYVCQWRGLPFRIVNKTSLKRWKSPFPRSVMSKPESFSTISLSSSLLAAQTSRVMKKEAGRSLGCG
jgi:hypothetical protein